MTDTTLDNQQQLFGHPKGLFYLFFAELWERFSFYGMRALLTLYMVNEIYAAFENRDIIATSIYASYGALVYATPVVGGMLADRLLGNRRAIILGGTLMAIGHFVLAIENQVFFFGALALIIVGNGLFKPNISSFVGSLYQQGDDRRDSGFTIFYMGINTGAFVAPLLCGWLGNEYGWHYGFGAAGVGMVLGLLVFMDGLRKGVFGDRGHAPDQTKLDKKVAGLAVKEWVPILAFLSVPLIALMMFWGQLTIPFIGEISYEGQLVDYIFWIILLVILGVIGKTLVDVTKEERQQLIVVVLLTMLMTLFWGFYELSGSTITLFADRNVNLVGMNAAQTNSLTALFIILFAFPFSKLWIFLSKKGKNPYTPYKFAFGLLILAVGFGIFSFSREFADADGRVPFIFMVIGYMLFATGELFMSPVGLSKVTELSPARIVSFMMGVWFLSSAFAFRLVGFVSSKLAVGGASAEEAQGLASLDVYTDGFWTIAQVTLVGALVAFLIAPIMKKWMHGVH